MKKHRKLTKSLYHAACQCERSKKQKTVRVIVRFSGSHHKQQVASLKRKLDKSKHHFKEKSRLRLIGSWVAHVSPDCLETICSHKSVAKVVLDRKNRINLDIATPAVGAAAVRQSGTTGRGVTVAVLDTGVAPHPDLVKPTNRIKAFKDFVNNRTSPYDDNGHGTHVAGDVAGNGYSSKGKYRGAAPGATIVGVKVLDQQGSGFDSTIIRGIEWCVNNRRRLGIRVLNLSLGKEALERCSNDPLCQAVGKAVRAGLVVTVSAGNHGPGRGTIDSPGISPSAITVGATDDRNTVRESDDRIAAFSSRGPAIGGLLKPDLIAPGVNIISLRADGSELDRTLPKNRVGRRYFRLSGTSFSAPITAGSAALLLQKQPRLTPSQVKGLLKRNAFSLKLPANTQGVGELNMRFAASRAKR
ncbi:S8 family peptidase [Paenibacillus agricola]|uniref:S8 family peptidase n=1 Tax=Paenibacillus agricola TaxID=2716264 RepID=UPI001FB7B835|nr:S8 family peptidase [Paenibacillus agricola]